LVFLEEIRIFTSEILNQMKVTLLNVTPNAEDTWYDTSTGHRLSTGTRRSKLKLPKPSESSLSVTVPFLFKSLVNDIKMLIVWELYLNPLNYGRSAKTTDKAQSK